MKVDGAIGYPAVGRRVSKEGKVNPIGDFFLLERRGI